MPMIEIAHVKTKELLLIVIYSRDAHKAVVEEQVSKEIVKTLAMTKQSHDQYNNPLSYQKYSVFNLKTAAVSKLEEKKAKEAKAVVQEAERLASKKVGRNCGQHAMESKKPEGEEETAANILV
ncbi:hypothetical protein N0V95_004903 [Ascochyta clinopodiicola]|nr:hypothetical protein N0V95_004903 [Ascochyta clinopodiicola]